MTHVACRFCGCIPSAIIRKERKDPRSGKTIYTDGWFVIPICPNCRRRN